MSNKNRKYYERLFQQFPDVVDTRTFCKMLGISQSTTDHLVQSKHVQSFKYLDQKVMIPKMWAIDFVLGAYYQSHKQTYKNQI